VPRLNMLPELYGIGSDCVSDVDERRVWFRQIFPAQRADASRNFPVWLMAEYQFGIPASCPHHLSMEASVGFFSDPHHLLSVIATCVGVTPVVVGPLSYVTCKTQVGIREKKLSTGW
jgi:hypothetical protein